jgi:hypothetical protein
MMPEAVFIDQKQSNRGVQIFLDASILLRGVRATGSQ